MGQKVDNIKLDFPPGCVPGYLSFLRLDSREFKSAVSRSTLPRLDNLHVVFGRVLDEQSRAVVRRMEGYGTPGGNPKANIVVQRCSCTTSSGGSQGR